MLNCVRSLPRKAVLKISQLGMNVGFRRHGMTTKKALVLFFFLAVLAGQAFSQDKEVLSLSLEDCVAKALKNNLSLAVEIYNPEIAQATLARTKEIFMPRFDLNYGTQRQENPPYWFIQGAGTLVTTNQDYGLTIVQQVPTGANISLSLSGYRSDTNQAYQLINPRYGSTLRMDLRQPLLRNFGLTVNRQQIIIARNNLGISLDQLKTNILSTIYLVEETYWNLVYAIENYKVKQQSLQLAKDLLAKNRREVDVGTLAPIEILNAEATVASREADILQAESLILRGEEVLKNIINLAAEGPTGAKKLVPADKPVFKERPVSRETALNDALMKRPDLQGLKKDLDTRQLNVSVARNQMLPNLDLQFSLWSPGISGDRLLYAGDNPFSGVLVGKEKGSGSDSIRDSLKFRYQNWSVGLTLSLPLSNLLTKADFVGAKLALEQDQARYKTLEQQARLEVSDAVREIETNVKRVQAYRIARELAEKRLDAEQKKLGVGLTTNYFVLQYQEELANARSLEIKSLVDYNLSLARLDKAAGTSLETRNIQIGDFLK